MSYSWRTYVLAWIGWLLVFSFLVPTAFAQGAGAVATDGGFQRIMNGIVRGTPGTTNVPITGGVRTTSTGSVGVTTARGISVNVPTSVVADFSRKAIIKGAARVAVRAVPWIGTGLVVNDIANAIKDSGIKTCPPPDFFCMPGDGVVNTPYEPEYNFPHNGVVYPTAAAQCAGRVAIINAANVKGNVKATWSCAGAMEEAPFTLNFSCSGTACGANTKDNIIRNSICKSGDTLREPLCIPKQNTSDGDPVPVPPDLLEQEMEKAAARDAEAAARWKRNMDLLAQANPNYEHPVETENQPVVVSASPVSAPPKVVSTETIPNADGSTSTRTVTDQVMVMPKIGTPSTVMNPNVEYPSTTTTVTKTVNNVTGKTETTTKTEESPSPVIIPQKLNLPTDYNREATQKSILELLKEFASPITAKAPDGVAEMDSIKAVNDEASKNVTDVTAQSVGIVSWLPNVPTAACVDPKVPTPLTGSLVSVPICATVDIFSALISGVLCFFCIVGCVQQVQAAQKA